MASRWLKADGRNRAWRTVLQGVAAVVLIPAADAALQVLIDALTHGGPFDWGRTATLAGISALTAATMALAAYLHRTVVDPSPVPSAEPPRPPGVSPAQAPATTPSI